HSGIHLDRGPDRAAHAPLYAWADGVHPVAGHARPASVPDSGLHTVAAASAARLPLSEPALSGGRSVRGSPGPDAGGGRSSRQLLEQRRTDMSIPAQATTANVHPATAVRSVPPGAEPPIMRVEGLRRDYV